MVRNFLIAAVTAGLFSAAADAGATGGPKYSNDVVRAHSTDSYTIYFHGGELARVAVRGDGDTDLDLYIYDENGNLIARDTGRTDYCVVRFRPRWTGRFTVRIKNLGRVYNRYRLETN